MSQEFSEVIFSGATIGFLTAAVFSESKYRRGLILGRNAKNNYKRLEVVAVKNDELNSESSLSTQTRLRVVGIYKCRQAVDSEDKFSEDDYRLMSYLNSGHCNLFLLVKVCGLRVNQSLYLIRNGSSGQSNQLRISPVKFLIQSMGGNTSFLYQGSEDDRDGDRTGVDGMISQVQKSISDLEEKSTVLLNEMRESANSGTDSDCDRTSLRKCPTHHY